MWRRAAYDEDVLTGRLFGRRYFLFNAPDAIHRVLVENMTNYLRPAPTIRVLRPIVGDGLLLSEGDAWKNQRRIVAPAFANRLVPLLARHIVSAGHDVTARLTKCDGEAVDLLAAMQVLALEIAARSMFSVEMGAHGPSMRSLIAQYRPRLGQPSVFDIVLPRVVPTIRDLARARFRSRWIELMDGIIAERLAAPPSAVARDLFDLLVAARDPETGAAFSRVELRDQVATMMVAGHETTALVLFWSLYLLASEPDSQARVAAEVSDVEFSAETAGELLQKLPFTRAVVNEALRLYPPAFIIARAATEADCCGRTEVPAGSLVMISPWVLHRHTRLWDRPEMFDPTRFLRSEPPPRFAFMPFGAGPRVCVGAQFGIAEAILILAMIAQKFELAVEALRSVMPAATVSMQPNYSVPFRLRVK
jgi:unspecific monooxygenase